MNTFLCTPPIVGAHCEPNTFVVCNACGAQWEIEEPQRDWLIILMMKLHVVFSCQGSANPN